MVTWFPNGKSFCPPDLLEKMVHQMTTRGQLAETLAGGTGFFYSHTAKLYEVALRSVNSDKLMASVMQRLSGLDRESLKNGLRSGDDLADLLIYVVEQKGAGWLPPELCELLHAYAGQKLKESEAQVATTT